MPFSMAVIKEYCFSYVVFVHAMAQIGIVLVMVYLGNEHELFFIQMSAFFVMLSVLVGNEISHRNDKSLKYIFLLMVVAPATIISETICINSITNIKTIMQRHIPTDTHSNSTIGEYCEGAKVVMSMNAVILFIVNGVVLTYICLHVICMHYLSD